MPPHVRIRILSSNRWLIGGLATAIGLAAAWVWIGRLPSSGSPASIPETGPAPVKRSAAADRIVRITAEQQKVIGVEVEPVRLEPETILVRVPGRIAPDETRFAFITPRAPGIVHSVSVRIGQDVKAGDVLATIESSLVGQARLDLLTNLQAYDVALAQARWQEMILRNTNELIERLKAEDTPEQIHQKFADKPVGINRGLLLTAYTAHRLAKANLGRKSDLFDQEIIRGQQLEETKARFDSDLAAYQTLLDQTGYETGLANIRAQQALRQAETAVLVAREKLQVLGVDPDDDDYLPKGLMQPVPAAAESAGLQAQTAAALAAAPTQVRRPSSKVPASLYKLKAPFAGTILDRELVVPGVAVEIANRIFTLANLDHVWIEANINPSNLVHLRNDRHVDVRFTSDAYPEQEFEAKVLYSGDMVIEKTQTVTMLARAENPEHLLKPGMYIDVTVAVHSDHKVPSVPSNALLSDDDRWIAFVRIGPEEFELRDVKTRGPGEARAAVFSGLNPGEDVVTHGAFKLKAELIRMASSDSPS
ncbi:Cobalt-zinc-cadmium resistance protein CzcB [Paludisphaera borealis]|uniref:Cobalt-zinc-cadmium resistance protein CzcB n=1 Tax=Paludisphaera borealis TaxID=1387353 RepID=A0A1U7CPP2_9BACT|nr:Cobalt-zinc-cadmium resistance protein CzcB [Paludisphaera borealis]